MRMWLPRALTRRLHRDRPFPPEWNEVLTARVPFFAALPSADQDTLRTLAKLFVWEKIWIPAGGIEMTDELRVTIAAAACRPILRLGLSYYNRLTEIVVYPGGFRHPEYQDVNMGEAHDWGVVVLAWDDVLEGLADPRDGYNTVFHEFAHVLDRATGDFDGTPRLHRESDYRIWGEVMERNFLELEVGNPRHLSVLDDYGAENEAEFFAVATESFFETPRELRDALPDLYAELAKFYRDDPAEVTSDE